MSNENFFALISRMPAPNGAVAMMIIGAVYWLFAWVPFAGLKIIKPNEALVLTLFGNYYGSLKNPGFFYVNPFCVGVNPAVREPGAPQDAAPAAAANTAGALDLLHKKDSASGKKISLKAITHNNGKQKINDLLGNPIEVGIVVIWRVVNTAEAVFNVDDYRDYLSIQADAALRNTVRLYPYDVADGGDDNDGQTSLRGSSQAVANKIKEELQKKVDMHSRNRRAGILIGQGKTAKEAMDEVGAVVEGYYAAESAREMAKKAGVELPIVNAAYDVLYEDEDPRETVRLLMTREKRHEMENPGWDS